MYGDNWQNNAGETDHIDPLANYVAHHRNYMRYCVKNISTYIEKYTINYTKLLKIFEIII